MSRHFFVLSIGLFAAIPNQASAELLGEGRQWIGLADQCVAPGPWNAAPLFSIPEVPAELARYCLYSWPVVAAGPAPEPPTDQDIAALFAVSAASELTEDIGSVYPQQSAGGSFPDFLRSMFRAHVGGVSLLPSIPAVPTVRVAVLDTAPDAPHGLISAGNNRHGDTLAHLIEDLVCSTGSGQCAAEVTSVLALPRTERGVYNSLGGDLGTLADLARAISLAVYIWETDRVASGNDLPSRLILNLSLGWEHTPDVADCHNGPLGLPARAVFDALQYAASKGVLIVAAAGNDSGGLSPPSGFVCPGLFQNTSVRGNSAQSLVVAASGVDYGDRALETVRPAGVSGIAALGVGGAGWIVGSPPPPALTGSSVSTAVVSAISALVSAYDPGLDAIDIAGAVYAGGVPVGHADGCLLAAGTSCAAKRASACGALRAAGLSSRCVPPRAFAGTQPQLPSPMVAALRAAATVHGVVPGQSSIHPMMLPRYQMSSAQLAPWVFPQPLYPQCPTCLLITTSPTAPEVVLIPGRTLSLTHLVLALGGGDQAIYELGPLTQGTAYNFELPPLSGPVLGAYVTGYDSTTTSATEQILVQY